MHTDHWYKVLSNKIPFKLKQININKIWLDLEPYSLGYEIIFFGSYLYDRSMYNQLIKLLVITIISGTSIFIGIHTATQSLPTDAGVFTLS